MRLSQAPLCGAQGPYIRIRIITIYIYIKVDPYLNHCIL